MITYSEGSIFDCGATAIVNPVNCIGVMGGGLARAFADKFPAMEEDYIAYCAEGLFRPGMVHSYFSNLEEVPIVLNFATKDDWRYPSEYEYVAQGLIALCAFLNRFNVDSVGVPALGCGLGGLDWQQVEPLIHRAASLTPNTDWIVFPPQ